MHILQPLQISQSEETIRKASFHRENHAWNVCVYVWTPNSIQMHRCINCFFSLPEASHARLVQVLLARTVLIEMFVIHFLVAFTKQSSAVFLQIDASCYIYLFFIQIFQVPLREAKPPVGPCFLCALLCQLANCQIRFPPQLSMEPSAGPHLL